MDILTTVSLADGGLLEIVGDSCIVAIAVAVVGAGVVDTVVIVVGGVRAAVVVTAIVVLVLVSGVEEVVTTGVVVVGAGVIALTP